MSCMFCKYYAGLKCYCLQAKYIETGSESFDCTDYEYNGEVKTK